jgi:hypothetical protein
MFPAPPGPPSLTPRALAAASPARVRSDIRRASYSATAAMMWTVNLLACGKSTASNSTFDSMRFETKATLRARRSSLATISLAPVRRQILAVRPPLDRPHVEGADVLRVREHLALLPFDCKELNKRGHVLLRAIDTPLRCVEVRGGALCELYSGGDVFVHQATERRNGAGDGFAKSIRSGRQRICKVVGVVGRGVERRK